MQSLSGSTKPEPAQLVESIGQKLEQIKTSLREQTERTELISMLREVYAEALLLEFLEREREARTEMDRVVRERMTAALQSETVAAPEVEDLGFGALSPELVRVPIPQGPPPNSGLRDTEAEQYAARAERPKPAASAPSTTLKAPASEAMAKPIESVKNPLPTAWEMGLNDRIALTKHLFSGRAEDYHRAISQLATFSTAVEAKHFVEEQLRPESDWSSVDAQEQLERLFELIQARFGA